MSVFELYLGLGFEHILDWGGRDHILFILVMICIYNLNQWKQIIWIVTSFTIAHSLSLVLAVLGWVTIDKGIIELLIALTILFTAIENLLFKKLWDKRVYLSGFFGLVHGLGFSNFLKSMFSGSDIALPLFSFNVGLELGQLLIVFSMLAVSYLLTNKLKFKLDYWIKAISILVLIQSVFWVFERA